MSDERAARGRAWILLAVLAAVAGGFGWLGRRLPVDVENHMLKAPGTPDAESLERRTASFGRDDELFAVFRSLPLGAGVVTEFESSALAALRESVEELDGVRRVDDGLPSAPGARAWRIELEPSARDRAVDSGHATETVERVLRAGSPATMQLSISGLPAAELVLANELQAEQTRVAPWVAASLAALLLAIYRRFGLVLAILAPPAATLSVVAGLQALTGRELTPVSVLLAPVVLTVGVAAGVHWIEAYLERRRAGMDAHVAARRAVDELREPALLASVTTVIGLVALIPNAIPAVSDFGALAAFGVALTYALAALATPALLVAFAAKLPPSELERRGFWTRAFGARLADSVVQRAPVIRAVTWLTAIAGLALCARLEIDNDPLRVLPQDHPFRQQTHAVADELGGSETFDVLAPARSALAEPVSVGLFAAWIADLDGVAGPAGPALHAENGDWLLRFVLAPSGSSRREQLFEAIERRASALGASEVRATGLAVQMARDSGRMIRGALGSALAGLALLWIVFRVGFHSSRIAWIALAPNVLPCIAVNAAMAAWGAPLSFATAIISSTMLGLIVDDTIHMLHRYRSLRARGLDSLRAIESVYQSAGRAVTITSATLAVGFAGVALGELSTSVEFGALSALTIVTAFFADVLLLPALLVRTTTVPDVVTAPARA